MTSALKTRRRRLRHADEIKQTTARIRELEHVATVARAELDRRLELALAGDTTPLARPSFVRSTLGGVLDAARQLTVARARLSRLVAQKAVAE